MDSDSDVPLSNLASMDYLRIEIATLQRLVAEKTARVQPSATSQAGAGRRSVPRILTAGTVYSPAATTPSSAGGWNEGRDIGRRSPSSLIRADRTAFRPSTTALLPEARGLKRGREDDVRSRGRDRPEPWSGEDDGNPETTQRTRRVDSLSSSDYSEDGFGETVVPRKNVKKYGRHSMGAKLGNYDESTCLQTFLTIFENCTECFGWDDADKLFQLRASLIGADGQILWDAGKQSTVSRVVALLKSRFGSEIKSSGSPPNCAVENEVKENLYRNIIRTFAV